MLLTSVFTALIRAAICSLLQLWLQPLCPLLLYNPLAPDPISILQDSPRTSFEMQITSGNLQWRAALEGSQLPYHGLQGGPALLSSPI